LLALAPVLSSQEGLADSRPDEGQETIRMSFNPRSDVILEVLNAADPARARLAAERLEALGANAPQGDFAADLDRAAASSAGSAPTAGLANARSTLAGAAGAPDAASRVKVEFEAMLLNSFVGEMLPKNAGSVFGEGTAGDIWRSMMSEQIARQIARSGALGLSRRLFATHAVLSQGESGRAREAAATAETSANVLSAPSAADIVNGAVLFSRRKNA
jgi:peptidoglycan hydrolase FlgJ